MVIFMGNSKPSQRFVFGLNFVKFTFLKGRKIKSNPGWVVSFPLAWNRHVPQGYPTFHLVHLHCNKRWKLLSDNLGYVVHSHFVLSSRCSQMCFCSSPSFHLLSLPDAATIFRSPLPYTPSHGGSFHPTSSSATHILYLCFCATILGNSCFFCPALCGHNCMNSDGVE